MAKETLNISAVIRTVSELYVDTRPDESMFFQPGEWAKYRLNREDSGIGVLILGYKKQKASKALNIREKIYFSLGEDRKYRACDDKYLSELED